MLNTCARLFTKDLDSKDLTYNSGNTSNGDSYVEFPYRGKSIRMIFSGKDGCYLSLYMVFERVPEDKVADAIFVCNTLNAEYKWVTFYVDRDNDVIFHDDAILAVSNSAEEAFELMARMLKIGDDVKPQIMRAIYA